MSARRLATAGAALLTAAGLGAFAATVFGGADEPAHQRAVSAGKVEFEVAAGGDAGARVTEPVARRGKRKPVVTHLISVDPILAEGGFSTFVPAKCPRPTGQPIGGGFITDGSEFMAPSVLSRFNPLSGRTPRGRYFIGVRNNDTETHAFDATLICAKGMRVR